MFDSRDLDELLPCVRERAVSFIARAELALGLKIIVCSTFRDDESQNALYQIGRRGIVGEHPVTNAKGGDSFHQYRVAFDIFPLRGGKPIFGQDDGKNLSDPVWQKLGEIAKEEGLVWGGTWTSFPEGPHFQYVQGLTLNELKLGNVPS